MEKWKRELQEVDGEYQFDGEIYITNGVAEQIPMVEIMDIVRDIRNAVFEQAGLDYLQVYKSDSGEKVYVIDNVDPEMKESSEYDESMNYCTIMLPEEY